MKRVLGVFLATAIVLGASVAAADRFTHSSSKVSVWIPDDWTMNKQGARVVVAAPKQEVGLIFFASSASNLEQALQDLDKELAQYVKNVRATGKPEQTTINGMPVLYIDGVGEAEGVKVELGIAVIKGPRQPLVMLAAAESAKLHKHEKTLLRILQSLKPAR